MSTAAPPAAEVSKLQYVSVVQSPLMWKGNRPLLSSFSFSNPLSLSLDITLTTDGFKMSSTCIRGADARYMTADECVRRFESVGAVQRSIGRRFLQPLSSGRGRQRKRTGVALRPSRARMSAGAVGDCGEYPPSAPWTDGPTVTRRRFLCCRLRQSHHATGTCEERRTCGALVTIIERDHMSQSRDVVAATRRSMAAGCGPQAAHWCLPLASLQGATSLR